MSIHSKGLEKRPTPDKPTSVVCVVVVVPSGVKLHEFEHLFFPVGLSLQCLRQCLIWVFNCYFNISMFFFFTFMQSF